MMNSRKVHGSFDPTPTSNDIVITKCIRLTTNVPQTGQRNITSAMVLNQLGVLPKASGNGLHFRFIKASVWSQQYSQTSVAGSDNETLTLTIPASGVAGAIPFGDGAAFSDNGTFGKRRPQLHVSPPTLVQQQWIGFGQVGQPDLLFQLQIAGDETSGTAVVLHVTLELRYAEDTG